LRAAALPIVISVTAAAGDLFLVVGRQFYAFERATVGGLKLITIKQRGLGKPNLYEINLAPSGADRKFFPVRTGNSLRSRPEISSD
jgi:hypothetical protein